MAIEVANVMANVMAKMMALATATEVLMALTVARVDNDCDNQNGADSSNVGDHCGCVDGDGDCDDDEYGDGDDDDVNENGVGAKSGERGGDRPDKGSVYCSGADGCDQGGIISVKRN